MTRKALISSFQSPLFLIKKLIAFSKNSSLPQKPQPFQPNKLRKKKIYSKTQMPSCQSSLQKIQSNTKKVSRFPEKFLSNHLLRLDRNKISYYLQMIKTQHHFQSDTIAFSRQNRVVAVIFLLSPCQRSSCHLKESRRIPIQLIRLA